MNQLYRKLIPLNIRTKYSEYIEYKGYKELKNTSGHVYYCFEQTKSIFIHIPKAGGISTIKSLYGENAGGFGHPNYQRFLRLYGKKKFDDYFKFTFVRNPWDKTLSAYNFLKKGGINHQDREFNKTILVEFPTFEKFIIEGFHKDIIKNWVHFMPQYWYVYDGNNLVVDFVGKFENIQQDFDHVRNVLGTGNPLKHLNETKVNKTHYRKIYTKEMEEKIAKVYEKDIQLFSYSF